MHDFLIALREQSAGNKRMHNQSVFVATKKSKQKINTSRSVKYCLWDVSMLSVIACFIF